MLFLGTNHLFVGAVHLVFCSGSLGFFSSVAAIASGAAWTLSCGQMGL